MKTPLIYLTDQILEKKTSSVDKLTTTKKEENPFKLTFI